jgi:sulfur-oxidizing protein SoxB
LATLVKRMKATEMTGETIKTVLVDVCDNLFNPDPCYQQGGDMVRVGGLQYSCNPTATMGKRIGDMRLAEERQQNQRYRRRPWMIRAVDSYAQSRSGTRRIDNSQG